MAAVILVVLVTGCASSPPPAAENPAPPPQAPPAATATPGGDLLNVRTGAGDSVGAVPGSADALYRYRFLQIAPASERFTYQDRDLSFYFKPTPDALHFQVENRQSRPVWIEWERSVFIDPDGHRSKPAHATSVWRDRFTAQGRTQIFALQRYSDYLFSLDDLLDPAGRDEQLHRPLFPEDSRAPQYADREFGVELAFTIEDRPRVYAFRFRVVSVIPR